jgi:hypothetical protein
MSVNINADTTNGLVLTSDTSGEIKLQSAGTDTVTVDSSGNVGIGTSSPETTLTVAGEVRSLDGTVSTYITSANGAGGYIGTRSNDYLSFQTNATDRMRIDSSGSLRVGGTSSFGLNEKIALYGTSTANNPTIISDKAAAGVVSSNHILFNNGNGYVGSITTLNSGTGFNTSSDYRLKENNVDITDGIIRVKQLNPYRFNFIANPDTTVDGFFAHEVQSVVPEAVTGTHNEVDDEGNPVYQGIDQSKLVPLLTAALQEAITKIEDLETRIQALENA